MKNTLKKLPFILAFALTILASGCTDDTVIQPVHTDLDPGSPPPPPPSPPK